MKFTNKKILFASLTLLLTACSGNEVETMTPSADGYGYISVGVSNDVTVQTRNAVTVQDLSTWTITAKHSDGNEYSINGNEEKQVKAGTYTVTASSHETKENVYEGYGEAYYIGTSAEFSVSAGETAKPTIDCGKAQNARIKVNFPTGSSIVTNCTLTLKTTDATASDYRGEHGLVLTDTYENSDLAYYEPNRELKYVLAYTYKETSKTCAEATFTLGAAATESAITITTDDNGIISITVTRDETFTEGNKETITINAATGEKV